MNPFSTPFERLPQSSHTNEETFDEIEVDIVSLKKNHSKDDTSNEHFPILPLQKHFSLPESNSSQISDSAELFKIRWAINELIQMEFDINIVYHIIQKIETSNKDPQILLNEIMDRYYQYLSDIDFHATEGQSYLNIQSFLENTHKLNKNEKKSASKPLSSDASHRKEGENSFLIEMKPAVEEIMDQNWKSCEICYEQKDLSHFYKISGCNHIFCHSCVSNYLLQKINSSDLMKIPCPAGCDYDFPEGEIEEIFKNDKQIFQKYKKFKNLLLVNSDPNLRWCIRVGCGNLIKCKNSDKRIKCEKCGEEMCFKCRMAWHGSISCLKALDNEFKNYSKNVSVKNCPKCKSRIEKNAGCNHMHCTRCNYDFCWLCMRHYKPDHYKWYNIFGCPLMQFQQLQWKKNCVFQSLKILLLMIVIPILIILLPFVFSAVALPGVAFVYCKPKGKIKPFALGFLFGVLGLMLTPLIIILMIFPGSCLLYREYKKRIADN